MHIAYLTGEYPRATDTFIQREVAALRQLGVEVDTFSVRRPPSRENIGPEQQAERDRTVYILPCSPFALVTAHLRTMFKRPGRYFGALKLAIQTRPPGLRNLFYQFFYFAEAALLAQQINQRGIAHLHNHFANSSCSVAMLAAYMGNFTFSFTMHGPAIFFEPHHWRIDEKLRRALFTLCISHYCRSQAMIFAPIEQWDRLHIVHCGVDPAYYAKRREPGTGDQEKATVPRLLYIGRLAAVKGLPVLLHTLAALRVKHPGIVLTVVGDGPDREVLQQMANDLGVMSHVRFVGYRNQAQVRDHLAETDIFVMSSFAEGVPVVLMEAMACGVPVVATRVAGVGELVEDGQCGFTVPPGDEASLTEKIETLLADEALRERFARAGRAKVEAEFNIHVEAAKIYDVLRDALPPTTNPDPQAANLRPHALKECS